MGDRSLTWRQSPDGSFVPPPGVTTQLVKQADGSYRLNERFGTVLAFDGQNRAQSLTDVDGNALSFTYDGNDRLAQVKDAYNRTLILAYTGGKLTQVADNQGRSVTYGYTGDDLTSYRDPENQPWQYGYDSLHQITTVTDPLNVALVGNAYDGHGRVIQQTAPRKTGTALSRLHYGGVFAADEDPQGHRTTYQYDDGGRTVAVENALGHTAKTAYDGQGHTVKSTDPLGHGTQYGYDGNHNLTQILDAQSHATGFTYDGQFRLIQTTDALGHSNQIDYDAKHHPTATRNALGQQAKSAYTAKGLTASRTDARNTATLYSYDGNGHPATAKTAAHPAAATQYDAIGRLTNLTDPAAGASTAFSYDKRSLPTTRTDPLAKTNTFRYDAAGRLTGQTDRNNASVNLTYTPSGKLDQISYPGGQTVSFGYDSADRLTQMTDATGTTANTYDAAGRLTGHTDPQGFSVQYQYDAAGNLTRLTYPGGKTVSYGYDALNRLQAVTPDWLAKTETHSYDAAGRLTQTARLNGGTTAYQYDAADRLTRLTHTANTQTLADWQYTLDANGNRTKALATEPRLPEKLVNSTLAYSYNTQKNRLTATQLNGAATNYTYDSEGQTKTQGATSFTFDYAHRLVSQGGSSYVYDGVGNRIKATRNGTVTKYVYDAAGNLLAEADAGNAITRYYVYGNGLTAMVDAATNALYVYHFDGTGHTVALTNAAQQTVNTYAYDPYGRVMAQTETVAQPFKYAGQFGVFAEGGNLYYMRARYYDASVGRFISEDPIGFQGGLNLYAYVGGNPVNLVDPSGLAGMVVMFPGYQVDTGIGFRVPLVHAGVVAIDNKTGAAQYFEFGRYGGQYGDVKNASLSGVSFNQNGSLTRESMQTLNSELAKFGQDIRPTTIYNSSYDAASIANFAIARQNNLEQHPYTINPFSSNSFNTCVNFAFDAFQAGGSRK